MIIFYNYLGSTMKRSPLPTLIGVFSSLVAIWFIHSFLIIDDCTVNNGRYDYSTGTCLLENGNTFESSFTSVAIALYFVVGFVVSFTVSSVLRKWVFINK